MKIEARQLCAGKRYPFQRLMVGRFGDSWRLNSDVAIRGAFTSVDPAMEFAIEPIEPSRLLEFWRTNVGATGPRPAAILAAIGFDVPGAQSGSR